MEIGIQRTDVYHGDFKPWDNYNRALECEALSPEFNA